MSDLFVDNIKHQSSQGSGTITIGASGETLNPASGTVNNLGIPEIDMWHLTSDFTFSGASATHVNSGWTRWEKGGFSKKGTGVTESSGTFSFPSTGYWQIQLMGYLNATLASQYLGILVYTTENNSTYTNRAASYGSTNASNYYTSPNYYYIYKCSDITTHKFRMYALSEAGTGKLDGNSTEIFRSGLVFKKIGLI